MKVNFILGANAESTRKLAQKHVATIIKNKLSNDRKVAYQ